MGSGRTGGPDYTRDQSGRDLGGEYSSGRTGGGLGKGQPTRILFEAWADLETKAPTIPTAAQA